MGLDSSPPGKPRGFGGIAKSEALNSPSFPLPLDLGLPVYTIMVDETDFPHKMMP